MLRTIYQTLFIFVGAFLYAFLFVRAEMGVNALLFSAVAIGALFYFRPDLQRSKNVLAFTAGTLFTAILTIWHHSVLAKLVHILSFFLLIGSVQRREVRFIGFALILGVAGFFEAPILLLKRFEQDLFKSPALKQAFYWLRMILLPFGIGLFFFVLYAAASQQFASIIENSWGRFFEHFFSLLAIDKIVIWGIGLLLTAALLYSSNFLNLLMPPGTSFSFTLSRKRPASDQQQRSFKLLALKHEYRLGLLTLALLNGVVLLFNITDLRYVWIDYSNTSPQELSQYVHEGTWLLLFTIALAIAIVLYFFRRNLNFFPNNDFLKALAGIWLFQNLVLTLSVAMRNIHYVNHYGLAYKRLAVFFFLLLTIFSIWTIYQKVFAKRTRFYLLQLNCLAIYFLLLLASTVNWDTLITKYNILIHQKGSLDVYFLVHEVSDKNIPILYAHQDVLINRSTYSKVVIDRLLRQKSERFMTRKAKQNWRDWNWQDRQTERYLLAHPDLAFK